MQIIPAVLTPKKEEFTTQLSALLPYFKRFHIDIADNTLVPNTLLTLEEIHNTIASKKIATEHTEFDFHLMVNDYEKQLNKLDNLARIVKINTVFIHMEVLVPRFFEEWTQETMKPFSIGIALNPEDSVQSLLQTHPLSTIPAIQIMTVKPGFQGQPFLLQTLTKIAELRSVGFPNSIYIDGGVNELSMPALAQLKDKPDFVCVGSYLTHHLNELQERIDNLKVLS